MAAGTLTFVGLGLHDEKGLTLKGLEAAKKADVIFAELYTSLMPGLSLRRLEELIGKPIRLVSRAMLEEQDAKPIMTEAERGRDVVLLVPGDPMVATTHVAVRLRAERSGVKTRVIHAPSIISAVVGLTGLQAYKFGRTTTITYPEGGLLSEAPYRAVVENKARGLHTICLLDTKTEERRFMTVREGLEIMLELEERLGKGAVRPDSLAVGIARAGSDALVVRAGSVEELLDYDFGPPPHTLVFPGQLHFMEAEALKALADAPDWLVERAKRGEVPLTLEREAEELAKRYVCNLDYAFSTLKIREGHEVREVEESRLRHVLDLAERYHEDAERFLEAGKHLTSIAAASYAEGLIDALRLLGLVNFEWPRA